MDRQASPPAHHNAEARKPGADARVNTLRELKGGGVARGVSACHVVRHIYGYMSRWKFAYGLKPTPAVTNREAHHSASSGHCNGVSALVLGAAGSGKEVYTGSRDACIRLHELLGEKSKTSSLQTQLRPVLMRRFEGHTDWVSSLVLTKDACTLVSGSADATIRIWDAKTGDCRRYPPHTDTHALFPCHSPRNLSQPPGKP